MRTKIEGHNGNWHWHRALEGALAGARAGDVIEVSTRADAQLAHVAALRGGADHGIVFEVDGESVAEAPLEGDELEAEAPPLEGAALEELEARRPTGGE